MKSKSLWGVIVFMIMTLWSCQNVVESDLAQSGDEKATPLFNLFVDQMPQVDICGTPVVYPYKTSAEVHVSNDEDFLYVSVTTLASFDIYEMYVDVGPSEGTLHDPADFLNFPYKAVFSFDDMANSLVFQIPYNAEWGACPYLIIKIRTVDTTGQLLNQYFWVTVGNDAEVAYDPNDRFLPYCWQECENPCPPQEYTLFGGQTIPVGKLVVWEEGGMLRVRYETTDGWLLKESHLFVGCNTEIPGNITKRGFIPVPGHFPFHNYEGGVAHHAYELDVAQIEACMQTHCVDIAAHAEVYKIVGEKMFKQTAWSYGTEFGGPRWGWYSTYCPCE